MRWLTDKVRSSNREQRKLLLSVGTNFVTRVPGAAGVLWFLPLLRYGLGVEGYASTLAAIALGGAVAGARSGQAVIGRRMIGEAYAVADRQGEADGFMTIMVAGMWTLCASCILICLFCWFRSESWEFAVVALVPVVGSYMSNFDAVRASYNEHYVTALLQTGLQISLYAFGIMILYMQQHMITAVLVLQGSYMGASAITGLMLLRERPYLSKGRATAVWLVIKEGMLISAADSCALSSLSLAVVWVQASAEAQTSAWFSTVVRLFETFHAPLVLLVTPLSSYVRLRWHLHSVSRQRGLIRWTLVLGVAYGVAVIGGLLVVNQLYVVRLLHLEPAGGISATMPCFLLFTAIVAYRCYSTVTYVVRGSSHLSAWSAVAALTGVGAALLAAVGDDHPPLAIVNVYATVAGTCMLLVLVWNAMRHDA